MSSTRKEVVGPMGEAEIQAGGDDALRAALGQIECFRQADETVLTPLLPFVEVAFYHEGDTIIRRGDYDGSVLYGLLEGTARLTKAAVSSGDIDMEDVGPGRLIGLAPLLAGQTGGQEGLSLVASTDLSLLYIDAEGLMSLTRRRLKMATLLLRYCAQGLMEREASSEETVGPERRVYRHILSLVERAEEGFWVPEMPRHAALGEATGTSDRVAAAAVAGLIADGIARRDFPGLTVLNMEGLRALAY